MNKLKMNKSNKLDKPNKYNLTEGSILNKLFLIALPIIGTQIIQMTYNLTDMFWLGRLGSDAVAASGTVGMYLWMSMAFAMFGRMGAEIGVSQNFGRGDYDSARKFAQNSISIGVIIGIILAAFYISARKYLIGFFGIQEPLVEHAARDYLLIVSIGIPFTFFTMAVSGIFNGGGNSRATLAINGVGLFINMVLDPIMIFTFNLGIKGAAFATITAQIVTACISAFALLKLKNRPLQHITLLSKPDRTVQKQIFKWVTPISVESFLFTFLSMIISALIVSFGSGAMAASRIGSQIESLTWLITGGYASALTAFIGQNFGAGKWTRIHRCVRISSVMMVIWGGAVTLLLYFGARFLYEIFLPDSPEVVDIGIGYLKILAIAQIPGCLEGVASGAFKGCGKTLPPSIASGVSNALRVVIAYAFIGFTSLGLTGIWIAVAIGGAMRGIWMYVWYLGAIKKLPAGDITPG